MKILILRLTTFLIALSSFTQTTTKPSVRVLLIPLDDRPACMQFTEKMGPIGEADVVTPPGELLGRFTTAGQPDKIIEWLLKQDLQTFNVAIISIDMLVYGGLVASRTHDVETAKALQRLEIIRALHNKAPGLRIYAQSVIMRLAPTADGKNEAYREDLTKWAESSVKNDEQSKSETEILVAKIPAAALANYKQARQRNLQINSRAIELVQSGILDYLVLSQDDAKPVGIHVADRQQLVAKTKNSGLTNKIAIQPGADEISMLLLARALNNYYHVSPKIKAVYSSGIAANTVMPFEDKPLRETVSYHIKASGSQEVENEKDADLLFYVFASRKDSGSAITFASAIEDEIRKAKNVIVADIDPVGNIQGGDSTFTNELERRRLLPELNGYASWNTAANTIGTALPQGVIFYIAETKLLINKKIADRIWAAQNWFTFHRVLDDYYFHGLQRLQVNKHFGQDKQSSRILDDTTNKQVEAYATELLQQSINELNKVYSQKITNSRQTNVPYKQATNLRLKLPWNRTFEAEISFDR